MPIDREVQRPGCEWARWIKTLRSGDRVLVCDWIGTRVIHEDVVRVTPTGRVHVGNYRHVDWAKSFITDVVGGGLRFIAPVPTKK